MRETSMRRALLVAVSIAAGAFGGRAAASGFQLMEQNGSGLGNAFAGQAAAAEDASTVFFNPAGLTRIPRLQLVVSTSAVATSTEFTDAGSSPATLQPSLGGDGGDGGDLAPLPNLYASWEALPGQLWAGIGVNIPFGLKTEWEDGWVGRFHSLKSEVKTVNINPTLAWKVLPWLSVGAGVNAQWIDAELSRAVNYSLAAFSVGGAPALGALAAAGCGTIAGGCEGVATVEGDDWSFGWNVGVMLEAPTQTRIGLSFRSKVEQDLEGDATFTNRPALLASGIPDGPIEATIELPAWFSVAIEQQVGSSLQLLADFTWTDWSSIQDLSIFRTSGALLSATPLNFEDSWRVGLGASYQLNPIWKLRSGVAYDKTPVQDEFRTPRLPDEDRIWAAGGLQWAFSQAGAIDAGFAYLFVDDASSDLDPVAPPQPSLYGNLKGEYEASVWIASVQAKYSF